MILPEVKTFKQAKERIACLEQYLSDAVQEKRELHKELCALKKEAARRNWKLQLPVEDVECETGSAGAYCVDLLTAKTAEAVEIGPHGTHQLVDDWRERVQEIEELRELRWRELKESYA